MLIKKKRTSELKYAYKLYAYQKKECTVHSVNLFFIKDLKEPLTVKSSGWKMFVMLAEMHKNNIWFSFIFCLACSVTWPLTSYLPMLPYIETSKSTDWFLYDGNIGC